MEIKVEEMDGMSQEELEALEDKVVEADAELESEPEESGDPEPKVDEPEAKTEEPETKVEEPEKPEFKPVAEEDDVVKHISPPSKWAAQRQALRESKAAIAEAERAKQEVETLRQELEWLKSQAMSKGVDTAIKPEQVLSPERISAVREEYGDELADMFQAVRNLQGVKTPAESSEQPKQPSNTTESRTANTDAMNAAIADNDELSYWQEHSGKLWDRAVEVNEMYLRDPEYVKLSFPDRFHYVVERVKKEVLEEAKTTAPTAQPDPSVPPESLSGAGSAPTVENKEIVDKILSASPEEQTKMYHNLSEAERDKLDEALGI